MIPKNFHLISLGCAKNTIDSDSMAQLLEGSGYQHTDDPGDAGVIIVPSHMGTKPIAGMHGYHPDHPDSDASLLSNVPSPVRSEAITDVFHIMRAEAGV